jgi:hypothetical protein
MIQDGSKIGRIVSVRDNLLGRPCLVGGIENVDRRWVGSVHVEKVDGVCELTIFPQEKWLSVSRIRKTNQPHT